MGTLAQTYFLNTAYKPAQLNGIFGNSFVELPTKQQDFALRQAYEIGVILGNSNPELAKSLFISIKTRKAHEILDILATINPIKIKDISKQLRINLGNVRLFGSLENTLNTFRKVLKKTDKHISDESISNALQSKDLFSALCEINLPLEVLFTRIRMASENSQLHTFYSLTYSSFKSGKKRSMKLTHAMIAYALYTEKLSYKDTARIIGLVDGSVTSMLSLAPHDSLLNQERMKHGTPRKNYNRRKPVAHKKPLQNAVTSTKKTEPTDKFSISDSHDENDIYKTWLYSKGDMNKTARILDRSKDDLLEQINSPNKESLLYRIKIATYLESDIHSAQVLAEKDFDAILADVKATNDNDYDSIISRIFLNYNSTDVCSALLTFWLNKFTQGNDYETALEMAATKAGYTRSTASLRVRESKPPNPLARFKRLHIHYPNQLPPIDSFYTPRKYTITPTNSEYTEYSDADIYNTIQTSKTFYSAFEKVDMDIVELFHRITNADFDSPLTWLKLLLNNKALRPESVTKDLIAYVMDNHGMEDFNEAISILTNNLGLKIETIEHHTLNAPKDHRLSLYKNQTRGYREHSPTTSHTRKPEPKKTLSHSESIDLIMSYIYRNKLKRYDSAIISEHTELSIDFVESVKYVVLQRYPDKTIQF